MDFLFNELIVSLVDQLVNFINERLLQYDVYCKIEVHNYAT